MHGAQSSQGSAPRVRCRRGNNDSPPHSAPGPAERAFTVQPTLLPPRSGICARGKERARTASPSRSGAQAEHGERPDKPCKRGRTEQTGQTFPKDPVPLSSATMLELSSSHVPQAVSRRKAPSARGVPQATGFPWRHTRIDITTILHNAPQLHYSLHPTLTIRSSPSQGPCVRRPLPKSSRTVLVLKGPKGIVRNPFSPTSLFRGSRNLVLSPITTQPLPVTSCKDRLAILYSVSYEEF